VEQLVGAACIAIASDAGADAWGFGVEIGGSSGKVHTVSEAGSLSEEMLVRLSTDEMWRNDAASRMLAMRIVSVAAGRATLSMQVRADMVNGFNVCHGGLIASLAESASGVACNSRGLLTIARGFDIHFLEPARLDDELIAKADEVTLRGDDGVYSVIVKRVADKVTIARYRGRSRGLGQRYAASSVPSTG
jgi:acyl-CoA thioesterase